MTRRIGDVVIIEDEPDAICSRCGKLTDTRDLLGNGTQICFPCATPSELDAYGQRLFGNNPLEN